jgi:hypothetical protein
VSEERFLQLNIQNSHKRKKKLINQSSLKYKTSTQINLLQGTLKYTLLFLYLTAVTVINIYIYTHTQRSKFVPEFDFLKNNC